MVIESVARGVRVFVSWRGVAQYVRVCACALWRGVAQRVRASLPWRGGARLTRVRSARARARRPACLRSEAERLVSLLCQAEGRADDAECAAHVVASSLSALAGGCVGRGDEVPKVSGVMRGASDDDVIHDDPHADAASHVDEEKISAFAGCACPSFRNCSRRGVFVKGDGQSGRRGQVVAQGDFMPPAQVRRVKDGSLLNVQRIGRCNAQPEHRLVRDGGGGNEVGNVGGGEADERAR